VEQKLNLNIESASASDISELSALFDAYRVFYEAKSDFAATEAFVARLITAGNTRFFLARETESHGAVGFVHLMPSISTVAMRPIWLLEDLFVAPEGRRQGVAEALMRHAEAFALQANAERLTLATAHNNHQAQALYKKLGYVREDHFWYFHRVLE
jgi:ribosomal protein S18 acetylase RimI-like enzyme